MPQEVGNMGHKFCLSCLSPDLRSSRRSTNQLHHPDQRWEFRCSSIPQGVVPETTQQKRDTELLATDGLATFSQTKKLCHHHERCNEPQKPCNPPAACRCFDALDLVWPSIQCSLLSLCRVPKGTIRAHSVLSQLLQICYKQRSQESYHSHYRPVIWIHSTALHGHADTRDPTEVCPFWQNIRDSHEIQSH